MTARRTREERRQASAETTRAERAAQGLPETIEDPATYARIGRLLDQPATPGTTDAA